MAGIAFLTLFGMLLARMLRLPRGSWRYVLAAGAVAALATQLLPHGHPLRSDVAESSRNLGWVALALVPVVLYALILKTLRRRAGTSVDTRKTRSDVAERPRGLVQIAEDAALVDETEAALAGDAARALGQVPRKRSLAWRAEDGALAGHLQMSVVGETCEIVLLRVADNYRGMGIGKGLLDGAEQLSRELGARQVFVRVGSWENLAFLRRAGLQVVWEQAIGPGAKWCWMEKELT